MNIITKVERKKIKKIKGKPKEGPELHFGKGNLLENKSLNHDR